VNANYFMPGRLGGDHSFRVGGTWHDANSTSINHTGGFARVRFPTDAALATDDCATTARGCQVDLVRDGYSAYDLTNAAIYVQDTVTHGRATLQLGVRYDYNHDTALAANIIANPLATCVPGSAVACTPSTVASGSWLPGISFPGADPNVKFNNFSPRLGLTYDLMGTGKTLLRSNYAPYYGR